MATNQKVGGSSPSWRAKSEQAIHSLLRLIFCLRQKINRPPASLHFCGTQLCLRRESRLVSRRPRASPCSLYPSGVRMDCPLCASCALKRGEPGASKKWWLATCIPAKSRARPTCSVACAMRQKCTHGSLLLIPIFLRVLSALHRRMAKNIFFYSRLYVENGYTRYFLSLGLIIRP